MKSKLKARGTSAVDAGRFTDLLSQRPVMVVMALVVVGLAVIVVVLFLRTRRLEDHANQLREDLRGLPTDDDIATLVQAELNHFAATTVAASDEAPMREPHVRFVVPASDKDIDTDTTRVEEIPTDEDEPEPVEPDAAPDTAPESSFVPAILLVPDGAEREMEIALDIAAPSGANASPIRTVSTTSTMAEDTTPAPVEPLTLPDFRGEE